MLLFSTVLDIKDSITPDDFIQLVIKWKIRTEYLLFTQEP